jgi:hypothetical protein
MKSLKYFVLSAMLVLGSLVGSASTYAGVAGTPDTAVLSWTLPTLNTDGTALSDPITSVTATCSAIIVGTTRSGCTLAPVSVAGTATTTTIPFTFTNTAGGQICWTLTVTITHADLTTATSAPSNEGCKTETPAPKVPAAATGLTVK